MLKPGDFLKTERIFKFNRPICEIRFQTKSYANTIFPYIVAILQ